MIVLFSSIRMMITVRREYRYLDPASKFRLSFYDKVIVLLPFSSTLNKTILDVNYSSKGAGVNFKDEYLYSGLHLQTHIIMSNIIYLVVSRYEFFQTEPQISLLLRLQVSFKFRSPFTWTIAPFSFLIVLTLNLLLVTMLYVS